MTDFVLSRGEPKTFEFTVTDLAGAAVDLTDAEITFVVYDLEGAVVMTLKSVAAGGTGDDIEIPDQAADSGADAGLFRVIINADLVQAARWADCWVVTAAVEPETFKVVSHAPFYVTGDASP